MPLNVNDIEVLQLAAGREREANKWYRRAADLTEDKNGKATYTWLAKEELRHLAKLRKQLKSLQEERRWLPWKSLVIAVGRNEFPPPSEAEGPAKVVAGDREALEQAIRNEKASIASYRETAGKTSDPEGKAMFEDLAREEEGHLALVEEEREWIINSRKFFTLHRFPPRV